MLTNFGPGCIVYVMNKPSVNNEQSSNTRYDLMHICVYTHLPDVYFV